ncbi:hypothetical protein B0H12DRAFT_1078364 [Mycena haematopus]|nr:hypothetical protein B0H12DRAFT_1078364 [Mycena haematopus]
MPPLDPGINPARNQTSLQSQGRAQLDAAIDPFWLSDSAWSTRTVPSSRRADIQTVRPALYVPRVCITPRPNDKHSFQEIDCLDFCICAEDSFHFISARIGSSVQLHIAFFGMGGHSEASARLGFDLIWIPRRRVSLASLRSRVTRPPLLSLICLAVADCGFDRANVYTVELTGAGPTILLSLPQVDLQGDYGRPTAMEDGDEMKVVWELEGNSMTSSRRSPQGGSPSDSQGRPHPHKDHRDSKLRWLVFALLLQ